MASEKMKNFETFEQWKEKQNEEMRLKKSALEPISWSKTFNDLPIDKVVYWRSEIPASERTQNIQQTSNELPVGRINQVEEFKPVRQIESWVWLLTSPDNLGTKFINRLWTSAKEFPNQMIKSVRWTSIIASMPFSYAAWEADPNVTGKETVKESKSMAKKMFTWEKEFWDYVKQASVDYLKKRWVTDMKDVSVWDIWVLTFLWLSNYLGDPILAANWWKIWQVSRDALIWKKVWWVTKNLAKWTKITNPKDVSIRINKHLKIKIKPSESEVVIEWYKKRFFRPKKTNSAITQESINESKIIEKQIQDQTGLKTSSKISWDDLIIKAEKPVVRSWNYIDQKTWEITQVKDWKEKILWNTKDLPEGILAPYTEARMAVSEWPVDVKAITNLKNKTENVIKYAKDNKISDIKTLDSFKYVSDSINKNNVSKKVFINNMKEALTSTDDKTRNNAISFWTVLSDKWMTLSKYYDSVREPNIKPIENKVVKKTETIKTESKPVSKPTVKKTIIRKKVEPIIKTERVDILTKEKPKKIVEKPIETKVKPFQVIKYKWEKYRVLTVSKEWVIRANPVKGWEAITINGKVEPTKKISNKTSKVKKIDKPIAKVSKKKTDVELVKEKDTDKKVNFWEMNTKERNDYLVQQEIDANKIKNETSVSERIKRIKSSDNIDDFNKLLEEARIRWDIESEIEINDIIAEKFWIDDDISQIELLNLRRKKSLSLTEISEQYKWKTEIHNFKDNLQTKLFNVANDIIGKVGKEKWMEMFKMSNKYVPKGARGSFDYSKWVLRMKRFNDVPAFIHEVTHGIDRSTWIVDNLLYWKNKIEKVDIIRSLDNIYKSFYPVKRKWITAKNRIREWLSMFVQKSLEEPQMVYETFPDVAQYLLNENSEWYSELLAYLLDETKSIVELYSKMDDLTKGAFLSWEVNITSENLARRFVKSLPKYSQIKAQFADVVYPLQEEFEKANLDFTSNDGSIIFREKEYIPNLVNANYTAWKWFWVYWENWNIEKSFDFNYWDINKELMKAWENEADKYSTYLVHRDQHFVWKELSKKISDIQEWTASDKDIMLANKISKELYNNSQLKDLVKIMEENKRIYLKYKDKYKELDYKLDKLIKRDLKVLYDSKALSKETYNRWNREWYVPLHRTWDAEFELTWFDINAISPLEWTWVSQLKRATSYSERKWSNKGVKNVVFNAMDNHAEFMRIYNAQKFAESMYNLSKKDISKNIEIVSETKTNNSMMRPWFEWNLFKFQLNWKEVKMDLWKEVTRVFSRNLEMQNSWNVENFLRTFTGMFVKGTTGIFRPSFAVTNMLIDFFTWTAQSRSTVSPLLSWMRAMSKAWVNKLVWLANKVEANNSEIMSTFWKKEAEVYEIYKRYHWSTGINRNSFWWKTESQKFKIIEKHIRKQESFISKIGKTSGRIMTSPVRYTEVFSRFWEFYKSVEKWNTYRVALFESAISTWSFWNKWYMFWSLPRSVFTLTPYSNTSVQIPFNMIDSIRDKKTRYRSLWVQALTSMISAINFALWALALKSATEEQRKRIARSIVELHNYEFTNSMPIISRRWDMWVKTVRTSEQYSVLRWILQMYMAERIFGRDSTNTDYFNVLADWLIPSVFNPFDPDEPMLKTIVGKWAWFIPAGFSWLFEAYVNTKTFPTLKKIEPSYLENSNTEDRYFNWTNQLAIKMWQQEWAKENELWPLKIEHIMKETLWQASNDFTKYFDEWFSGVLKWFWESFQSGIKTKTYEFAWKESSKITELKDELSKDYRSKNLTNKEKADIKYKKNIVDNVHEIMLIMRGKQWQYDERAVQAVFNAITELNKWNYDKAKKYYQEHYYKIQSMVDENNRRKEAAKSK